MRRKSTLALMLCLAVAVLSALAAVAIAQLPASHGPAVCENGAILATTNGGASTIVVGTNPDYPPYESLSSKTLTIVGFDIDLVKAIGERAGFAIEWRSAGFGELLIPGLQDPAEFDMVASALTPTAERDAYVDFSDTYIEEPPYGPVAFAFPTGSALRGVVNTALQQVKDDGTQAKLFKRWFKPKITKLKPTATKRNRTVTIIGSEFGTKRGKSYVKFGAKKCTKYVSWNDAKIKCRVPKTAKISRLKVRVTTTVGTSNAKLIRVRR
jgi:ABC-type amino acid transport substrate-binding protein